MSIMTRTRLVLPETEDVEQKIVKLNLTGAPRPLKLGDSLDGLKKTDLTPLIGTEFARGIQLRELLNAPTADELLRDLAILVSQRGVVFFREQDIATDEQKLLAAKLGELTGKPESSKLHIHPITAATSELGDEFFAITSERRKFDKTVYPDSTKFGSKEWHADISFEPVPSDYAVLKMHTLPDTGGDTLWASGYEVYDRLSPSFAKCLESLEAVHEGRFFKRSAESANIGLRDGERGSPGNFGSHLEAVHPIIRTNPVTGWKSVFVNETFTKRIIGVTRDESDIILRHLFNLVAYNHDLQVRFKWEKNSVAIWDNRSNYHAATHDHGMKRVGERVLSLGEKPYLDLNSKSRRESFCLEKK